MYIQILHKEVGDYGLIGEPMDVYGQITIDNFEMWEEKVKTSWEP